MVSLLTCTSGTSIVFTRPKTLAMFSLGRGLSRRGVHHLGGPQNSFPKLVVLSGACKRMTWVGAWGAAC